MICFITDRKRCGINQLLLKIREAALAGVDYILLRENDMTETAYEGLLLSSLQMLTYSKTEIVVCHRPELAKKYALKSHRRFLEHDASAFSVATHHLDEVHQHQGTYCFYSPIFTTDCKPGVQPKGTDYYREDMIALGGINQMNIHQLKGFKHIGIMSEWLTSDNIQSLLQVYRDLGY